MADRVERSAAYQSASLFIAMKMDTLMTELDGPVLDALSVDERRELLMEWDLFDVYDDWRNDDA